MKKIFLMLSLVIAFGFQSFGQKNNAKEDKESGEYEIITENRNVPQFENLNGTGHTGCCHHDQRWNRVRQQMNK